MHLDLETLQIIVKGKVQGVYYRQSAKEKAKELGITGYIRNTLHGEVLITVTGRKDQLQEFIKWCRQGPPRAIVRDVSIQSISLQNFETFYIER